MELDWVKTCFVLYSVNFALYSEKTAKYVLIGKISIISLLKYLFKKIILKPFSTKNWFDMRWPNIFLYEVTWINGIKP